MIGMNFLWGVLIGISVAAPIGPVNLICLQRTLKFGLVVGLISGLGAALGDALFGFIAAFGVTAVADFIMKYQTVLQTVGGFFLIWLAVHIWREHPHLDDKSRNGQGVGQVLKSFVTTFLLTITNPMTILGFVAIFASVGLSRVAQNFTAASLLVAGVFSGSVLWWLVVTNGARFLKGRMNDSHLLVINRASALLVALFGVLALARNWFI
jgi:threonine/homoserine/homoserine lactone efflux protein